MGKAFGSARLMLLSYLKSGKEILPALGLIAFLLVYYHVKPFNVAGSFSISMVALFVLAVWLGLSVAWAEEPTLFQILSVKVGMKRLLIAQQVTVWALAGIMGVVLVMIPVVEGFLIPSFFIRPLTASDILSAVCLNLCAGFCGCAFGALFHPRLIGDRKMAYILCIMICLISFVSGRMGMPAGFRFLLPPVYDSLAQVGITDVFGKSYLLTFSLRYLIYALLAGSAQVFLLNRRKF